MAEEIKLIKRSKVERLAIANTLIDSVMQETDNSILLKGRWVFIPNVLFYSIHLTIYFLLMLTGKF